MVIFASEDVGNADPQALVGRGRRDDAFRFVGLPEGFLPMTAGGALPGDRAQVATRRSRPTPPPRPTSTRTARCRCRPHLRNASTPLQKSLGWGAGYQYPHDFDGHYVREEYLPEALRGHRYYQPSDSGDEREIAARLERLRSDAVKTEAKPEKKK